MTAYDTHPVVCPDSLLAMGPGSGRVLVVDDDAVTRHRLAHVLQEAGFAVVSAGNGASALQLLRDDPSIRVILLDLEMPGLSGWELRRAQRADRRLARVATVIVTATPLELIVDEELRAADYLLKPVSHDHLVSVIAKYCAPGR